MTKKSDADRADAIETLRVWLKPGDVVHTILRHCSRSGMSRSISLIANVDGNAFDITFWVARALADRIDSKHGGIKVGGCGMDMGFHVVYSLGRVLFPDGFKLSKGQHGRNGDASGYDNDAGYALTHRWL